MQEQGANSNFVQGFMKEAQDNGFQPMDLSKPPMTNTMSTDSGFGLGSGAPKPSQMGQGLGAPIKLDTPAAPTAPAPTAPAPTAPAPTAAPQQPTLPGGQTSTNNNEPIPNTMPKFDDTPKESRHEIIPGLNNKWVGGLGGLLLGTFINNEMGVDGPMGMILPLLGAGAGYRYLPKLMNKWKDPAGTGANAIHPAAININKQFGYNM